MTAVARAQYWPISTTEGRSTAGESRESVTLLRMFTELLQRMLDADPEMERIRAKLESFLDMEEDWDGDGALLIDSGSVRSAQRLIEDYRRLALQQGYPWNAPGVSPAPDGGVVLSWHRGRKKAMLIFHPNRSAVGIAQAPDRSPTRQVLPNNTELTFVVHALSSK